MLRPVLERRISLRGPRFWVDQGVLMFCNQIDGSTRDGPREATQADVDAHGKAFADREGDEPFRPLVKLTDPPADVMAAIEADKAGRQSKLDAKRGGL